MADVEKIIEFILAFKEKFKKVNIGEIIIDYKDKNRSHWENVEFARLDFAEVKKMISKCKTLGIKLIVRMPIKRFETPYFFIFEEVSNWTKNYLKKSWLEYITIRFQNNGRMSVEESWNRPDRWTILFRDLLRQTWLDKEFLLHRWKDDYVSENQIP